MRVVIGSIFGVINVRYILWFNIGESSIAVKKGQLVVDLAQESGQRSRDRAEVCASIAAVGVLFNIIPESSLTQLSGSLSAIVVVSEEDSVGLCTRQTNLHFVDIRGGPTQGGFSLRLYILADMIAHVVATANKVASSKCTFLFWG